MKAGKTEAMLTEPPSNGVQTGRCNGCNWCRDPKATPTGSPPGADTDLPHDVKWTWAYRYLGCWVTATLCDVALAKDRGRIALQQYWVNKGKLLSYSKCALSERREITITLVISVLLWGSSLATTPRALAALDKAAGEICRRVLGVSQETTYTSNIVCAIELLGAPGLE